MPPENFRAAFFYHIVLFDVRPNRIGKLIVVLEFDVPIYKANVAAVEVTTRISNGNIETGRKRRCAIVKHRNQRGLLYYGLRNSSGLIESKVHAITRRKQASRIRCLRSPNVIVSSCWIS